jgi:SPFH domain / Band 7 family
MSTIRKKLVVFVVMVSVAIAAEKTWLNVVQPQVATKVAVEQLNGNDNAFRQLRLFESYKSIADIAVVMIALGTAWWLMMKPRAHSRRHWPQLMLLGAMSISTMTGCVRPYDRPEYAEIDTSETGFLIPLEGNTTTQARFQSEEYLRELKVAAKRVQITHRWSQEGRLPNSGRWISTVRLIKVNRSPVTREWTAEATTGTASKNQAIWIESSDSVGFSMGFTCTAFISEEEAAKFLYWYPSGSLAQVMDSEVRARIQQVAAEIAAKYPLDALRARKQEIADAVKNDIRTFFAQRGVTITTIGMFGGMTYENAEIQKSIDNTVIAQQLKVVNQAKWEAQQRENDRVTLEANAVAERSRRIAAGEADAKKIAAAAEAEAIRQVNQALAEAKQNPLLYQLRSLEIERARIERWNGQYPGYLFETGTASPNLMLQLPSVVR